jgi:hypothetical protein
MPHMEGVGFVECVGLFVGFFLRVVSWGTVRDFGNRPISTSIQRTKRFDSLSNALADSLTSSTDCSNSFQERLSRFCLSSDFTPPPISFRSALFWKTQPKAHYRGAVTHITIGILCGTSRKAHSSGYLGNPGPGHAPGTGCDRLCCFDTKMAASRLIY